MYGVIILTIAAAKEHYWIPKKVIIKCFECKRFSIKSFITQQQAILLSDRTTGTRPFQVVSADFLGPIMYRKKNRRDKKAYVLLFKCSLTRAINLESLPDQTTDEFIGALKRLIASREYLEMDQEDQQTRNSLSSL